MAKPFDYSKWDNIELSDDEEDLHPNIDKDSWFRWKHKARIDREEKEAKEKQELDEKNALAKAQKEELLSRLQGLQKEDASKEGVEADIASLKAELAEVEEGIKQRLARLDEMEKNRKLNVDNIGTVVKDFTSINRRETRDVAPEGSSKPLPPPSTSKSSGATAPPAPVPASAGKGPAKETPPAPAPPSVVAPHSEVDEAQSYNNFVIEHEDLLERFSELESMDESKEMLHTEGYILLSEHSQSYLLLSCLEDEMNGKHDRMKHTARQSQILSHIIELAASLGRSPRDVVMPFFHRLQSPEHLEGFLGAVSDFIKKIQKRAVEKRKEMAEARRRGEDADEVEVPREERLGPGGLDPVEVFEQLPASLQEAFESQDMERLQKALADLPVEEARRHMKACADSGLWVPSNAAVLEEPGDDA